MLEPETCGVAFSAACELATSSGDDEPGAPEQAEAMAAKAAATRTIRGDMRRGPVHGSGRGSAAIYP